MRFLARVVKTAAWRCISPNIDPHKSGNKMKKMKKKNIKMLTVTYELAEVGL